MGYHIVLQKCRNTTASCSDSFSVTLRQAVTDAFCLTVDIVYKTTKIIAIRYFASSDFTGQFQCHTPSIALQE